MRLKAAKILGFPISVEDCGTILKYIEKYLNGTPKNRSKVAQRPLTIVTPNPEQLVRATSTPLFGEVLKKADIAVPDGIGVVIAMRFLGASGPISRVTGVDLVYKLSTYASKRGVRIGLIGGNAGLAERAGECLAKMHPQLDLWAIDGPDVSVDDEASDGVGDTKRHVTDSLTGRIMSVVRVNGEKTENYIKRRAKDIKRQEICMVFVGLGAPKQEYLMYLLGQELKRLKHGPVVLMAVGGSFDFISGRVHRAPRIVRQMGCEWLWRLVRQPWRWHRQLALITYIYLVIRERFRGH
jgi:N-acetylglucosaminyldiphosphoundecaprenol N-acetyl-beta-D-mannosaminyltransferase